MILLDTHIWLWWNTRDGRLGSRHAQLIRRAEAIGVSVVSCWEIAKLVEYRRLKLSEPVEDWIAGALTTARVRLLPLTPRIAVESTQLPGSFHRDPADQFLVATARVYDSVFLTIDRKILAYPHVQTPAADEIH